MTDPIRCRARLERDCDDGDEAATMRRRRDVGNDWRADGTYRPASDSIICDPCYVRLHGILSALPTLPNGREQVELAIQVYRAGTRA